MRRRHPAGSCGLPLLHGHLRPPEIVVRGDDVVDPVEQLIDGLLGVSGHVDGLVDDQDDLAGMDPERLLGHDLPAPDDRDRHDGDPRLQGQVKNPFLEGMDLPVHAPRPLGEGHDRFAFPDLAGRIVDAPHGPHEVLPVDGDGARPCQGVAEDGDMEQLFLGDPGKVGVDVGQDDQDVEPALVIGHEDLRPAPEHVALPDNLHLDARDPEKHPGPEDGNPMGRVLPAGKEAVGENDKERDEGGNRCPQDDQDGRTEHKGPEKGNDF